MRVGHNMWTFNIFGNYKTALTNQSKAMANISSGLRVNSAGDDPYAIAKDQNFNMQLRSIQKANTNSQDTISLIQTADSALDGISSVLQRVRDLAVQSKNGTYNTQNRDDIQLEVSNLVNEMDHLSQSTNINDISLLKSSNGSVKCMVGSAVGETIDIPTYDFRPSKTSDSYGIKGIKDIDVTTAGGCDNAINLVDSTLDTINKVRDKYGALQNRLTSTIANQSEISEQTESGDSELMDADVASEMLDYSKSSIKVQAGVAMMAQTNKFPQEVLSILQNVR